MNKFKQIQNSHLALTQYHRWYQVYEVPFNKFRIDNQLEILADEIEITTSAGTSKGKANLEDRLKDYEGWQNAHHVLKTNIKLIDDITLSLEADILYQNIRPDNSRYSCTIHYSTLLKKSDNILPLFTSVKIQPTGNIENPEFISAYVDNRAKSFMHYWLYCIETANGNSTHFKELLATKFELNLSTNELIDNYEKFDKWIVSIHNPIKISGHKPKNFSSKLNDDQTISVSVDFEWQGVSVDDKEMTAETHHEWNLENNLDERFARMKTMKVTETKPFQNIN